MIQMITLAQEVQKLLSLEERIEELASKSRSFASQLIQNQQQSSFFFSDALSTALSALYAKFVVIMGIAMPVTEILSNRIPAEVYQGFYVYLYAVSISFVIFVYVSQLRQKAVQSIIKSYRE